MKYGSMILLLLFMVQTNMSQLYTFQKIEEDYIPLEDATQISGNEVWSDTIFQIPVGFNFMIYGRKFDSCFLQQGNLFFNHHLADIQTSDTAYCFFSSRYNIDDSGDDNSGSLSPVYYKTEGIPGNRVFIIEYVNTKIKSGTNDYTIDFQIRLHEYNGTLEIHYGSFSGDKALMLYMGVSMVTYNQTDSIIVIRQTRISGLADIFKINDSDPWIQVSITPAKNDAYRFMYDRDIILNNYVDMTLISELGNDYNLNCNGEIIFAEGRSIGAEIGHNFLRDYEWAERFILSDSAVLKGFVSQNYGFASDNDSVSYGIYLPGNDRLPDKNLLTKKISFKDLDLNGNLNIAGIDPPVILKDTFFISFGIPPYDDYSENCIGIYYTYADPYMPTNYDYGRTTARWMDGNWYDIFTSRYIDPLSPKLPYLPHTNDLIHFSLAPLVNFFTRNMTPVDDHVKAVQQLLETKQFVEYENIRLYPPYPNPAMNSVTIGFEITEAIPVKLSFYKLNGAEVFSTIMDCMACQTNHYDVEISNWESGEYIGLIQAGTKQISFVIIKL
jgi:hypothetical protein